MVNNRLQRAIVRGNLSDVTGGVTNYELLMFGRADVTQCGQVTCPVIVKITMRSEYDAQLIRNGQAFRCDILCEVPGELLGM